MVVTDALPASSYTISHRTAATISDEHFMQCFKLLKYTSAAAYRTSSIGWSKQSKITEMRDADMEFLLVLALSTLKKAETSRNDDSVELVQGFLSYMLTQEDDMEVVYCYEIHLSDSLRSQGIGKELMQRMHEIGRDANKEKAMLTVFTSNVAAMEFYRRLGYEDYDKEPAPASALMKLRSGRKPFKPTYIIMAKNLHSNAISGAQLVP